MNPVKDKSSGHRSRVSNLMIDCLADRFNESLAFWTRALGFSGVRRPSKNQRYVTLGQIDGPLFVRLQKVEKGPGFHLDIETDRIDAEVERLKAAGANPKYHLKRWWVLEDPSGTPFCVIRPESDDFPQNAQQWEDNP